MLSLTQTFYLVGFHVVEAPKEVFDGVAITLHMSMDHCPCIAADFRLHSKCSLPFSNLIIGQGWIILHPNDKGANCSDGINTANNHAKFGLKKSALSFAFLSNFIQFLRERD